MVVTSTALRDPDIRTRTSWIDADIAKNQVKKVWLFNDTCEFMIYNFLIVSV